MPSSVKTDDLRILEIKEVINPEHLSRELPISEIAARTTLETRQEIHNILHGTDDRILVVVGPCSIHDPEAAKEYAHRLLSLRKQYSKELVLVMRVYFEKPRTTVGWKGLINDPDLDGSFNINKGLRIARKLLIDINSMGIPAGTEYLDIITPQYVADLITWGAIGARTTESQVHREVTSGLSCPVGLKNGTNGNLTIAVDAIRAAAHPHHFLSLTKAGHSAIYSTAGNKECHLILRGGKVPNYDSTSVDQACNLLAAAGLPRRVMIDFSHANSGKNPTNQLAVAQDVAGQVAAGDRRIMGAMIEGNLLGGRQNVVLGEELVYGQSITDACLGWEATVSIIDLLAQAVTSRRTIQ